MEFQTTILLASVIAGATPILFATIGETITEKGGLINLSLDGSILLSAMVAFAIAFKTDSIVLGFCAAALTGAMIALLVGVFAVYLKQSQVAVGFVLTLMARDLAYFLGNSFSRLPGPSITPQPIPLLKDMPVLGEILFSHNLPVYGGMILIFVCWWYMYRTPYGLILRSVGENPRASFARGINPGKVQLSYALIGGLFVGLAGAAFSLCIKPGWGRPQGAEGSGWIALALVIFGGWHPFRAAVGAYLFSFLQVMGIYLQGWFPSVPAQVFQVAPFPLMIFTLLIINLIHRESFLKWSLGRGNLFNILLRAFSGGMPSALGKPHQGD